MRTCLECQSVFLPKRKEQVYCSHSCAGVKKGHSRKGKKLGARKGWNYSRNSIDKDGYVKVYARLHPFGKRHMIAEQVMMMELKIGRKLLPEECVHHINGIKTDNRIENLELMTRSKHSSSHGLETVQKRARDSHGRLA